MNPNAPVVIGYDAISPLGIDLETQWCRALSGKSGIGPLTRIQPGPEFPVQAAGQVEAVDHLGYPFLSAREQARWISPVFKYSLITVQRALERSGLVIDDKLAPRTAVTYSSAIGGLDAILSADRNWLSANRLPLPCMNPNGCINMVAGKVSMLTGATGPITTTITACATGLTSIIIGAMLIEQGRVDAAICGAVDFPLVEPILAGFASMNGSYAPKENAPPEAPETLSRPFSLHRRGFVASEGAGCVILAGRAFANANGLLPVAEIAGWSMTSDAHHFVAPHYPTVRRCMEEAISEAGIAPADVQAVNAHATSTRVGDQVEADALRDIFGDPMPPVTANKSLMGHVMGASSAIETVYALLGMRDGILPPTLNYQPDPTLSVNCAAVPITADQTHVLKNAFGFGGCNACILFRRI